MKLLSNVIASQVKSQTFGGMVLKVMIVCIRGITACIEEALLAEAGYRRGRDMYVTYGPSSQSLTGWQ